MLEKCKVNFQQMFYHAYSQIPGVRTLKSTTIFSVDFLEDTSLGV